MSLFEENSRRSFDQIMFDTNFDFMSSAALSFFEIIYNNEYYVLLDEVKKIDIPLNTL
jgi:hypothetical protein